MQNIRLLGNSSHPRGFVTIGSRVFFTAQGDPADGGIGMYRYEYDSVTETATVTRLDGWGGDGAVATDLTAFSNHLYFVDGGTKIRRTDGLDGGEGFVAIKNSVGVEEFPQIEDLVASGDYLYAVTVDPDQSIALWRIDHELAQATQLVASATGSGVPVPASATDCNHDGGGMLAFAVATGSGFEIWSLSEGASALAKLPITFTSVRDLVAVDETLYFAGKTDSEALLWYYDGVSATKVIDEFLEVEIAEPEHMVAASSALFFVVNEGFAGDKPMQAIGASAESSEFFSATTYAIRGMAASSSYVWFLAAASAGNEVWRIQPSTNVATFVADVPGSTDAEYFVALTGSDVAFCFCSTVIGADASEYMLIEYNHSKGTTTEASFVGLEFGENADEVTVFGERVLLRADNVTDGIEPWHYPDY